MKNEKATKRQAMTGSSQTSVPSGDDQNISGMGGESLPTVRFQNRQATSPQSYGRMNTDELRSSFLAQGLFQEGEICFLHWEVDRTIIGGVIPLKTPVELKPPRELDADFFCENREAGVINIGKAGEVLVDGKTFPIAHLDCLYIGRGSREIIFSSDNPRNPARFYLVSYPAHAAHPTTWSSKNGANQVSLGSSHKANKRTIFQYIHEGGARSCQLAMGFTRLGSGSVWNTMPPHTHSRRSEVYLYFGIPQGEAVFHLMGRADETRHLAVHNEEVVLSPSWSLHAGCGSANYSFVWAMGGENRRFSDMDGILISELR